MKMRIKRHASLPILFLVSVLIFLRCEDNIRNSDTDDRQSLLGSWEESFRWSNLYNTYYIAKGRQRDVKDRVR
jgi:hypothetical protein